MPLTGLDQVDWAHIHHSPGGTAEKFPKWLEALVSDDDLAWADEMDIEVTEVESALDNITLEDMEAENWDRLAFQNLVEYSNHQGSIYEVTPYVIPFVNQILGMVSPEHQRLLLFLLGGYARGYQFPNEDHEFMRGVYERKKIDFDAVLARDKQAVEDTHARLQESISLYTTFLTNSDLRVRKAAVELIGAISEYASEARQILVERLKVETDEDIRAAIHAEIMAQMGPPGLKSGK